jgi:hypothetical protein
MLTLRGLRVISAVAWVGIGWCAVAGLEDAHAECPRVHSAVSSMAHGIVRAPPRSQPVNRQACLHTEKRVSKIFGFSIETTSLRSAFYLCRGFDARVL